LLAFPIFHSLRHDLMTKKLLLIGMASALLALAALPFTANAKTRMLLVGVADYNEASGIHDLQGPATT
jgi:hypothetical protein